MTQLEWARQGKITPEMARVAEKERRDPQEVLQGVSLGRVAIPANRNHRNLDPCGIGQGLRTKVNANLGTSPDWGNLSSELGKLRVALEVGADTVMDLSTGGDIRATRRALLSDCPVPLGTVPIYQAAVETIARRGSIVEMTPDDLFSVIEEHARDGVDFITVHCGVTSQAITHLREDGRVTDVVSRGGAFLIGWMLHHQAENPLYEQFDRLLEVAQEYDVTLSLGDGLRPGSLADASDRAQMDELHTLGELVERAWQRGVQVMVEGPGHVPMNQVVEQVRIQKEVCQGAPFYVLGPLVTDVASGYDHISAAIGGAVAAAAGADFLCYVTPAEHLSLPDVEDVRQGVVGARIAAHAADIVKGIPGAWEWDKEMSLARKNLDWEKQLRLSIDPERARKVHSQHPSTASGCSMCGQYCAMDLVAKYLGSRPGVC